MQEAVKEDYFKTIQEPAQGEYREKGSKFLAYVFPVSSIEDIKQRLEELKKEHHNARHHCFAYRINPEDPQVRANDDGEPSNSAGMPIFNQILSFDVWNILVVTVRYFGGTKLGVSGLMNAYKTAAALALENAALFTEYLTAEISIRFPYKLMHDVMRLIKEEEWEIKREQMNIEAGYTLAVRKNQYERALERIGAFHEVVIL